MTSSRLRASDLEMPFRAVRRQRLEPPADSPDRGESLLLESLDAYAQRMTEHEFFSHISAAVAWGVPLPRRMLRAGVLDVSVIWPRRAPAGRGVRGHALRPWMCELVQHPVLGVAVSSPASTWAMLSSHYQWVDDAVVAADAIIREQMHPDDPPPLAGLAELEAAADAGRRIGGDVLRNALPLAHPRSRSRPETLMRLLLGRAGLGGFLPNFDVLDGGVWIAQVDFALPRIRLALEYEGEHHLTDPVQWAKDIARMERLIELGWRVMRVTQSDLFGTPELLVARIRRAIDAAR
ncbi:MAG: DUF559 domain-containing protein [Microbacterium sp.]|uniref:endonuclease domain-containing protein n=1 Tax=Microbacterium TaxID=33882 RepID=UPI001D1743D9|nr:MULTISPECIES: DUF559 domain-containing protein [Microbacterium]MCC4268763.1 endonuclease domain-containing protein [Microbacterium schleiferi]